MSEPKPRIQLSCERGASAAYADAVTAAGGIPCPGDSPEPDLSCAGLVLCGGGDLDPELFGWPQAGGDPPDRERDVAELALFRAFYQAGRPILGICRGMQALNVFFGGTLHARIPGHQQVQGDLIHPTRARGLLSQLLGPAPLVNSNHHQAVRVLGEELCLLQQAADGTIEGFCHETLPILGVQWHPERQSGARLRADAVDAGPLLRYFVGQCSCKSAPGLVHCEKRGEADESHHTGTKSGAGTAYGG